MEGITGEAEKELERLEKENLKITEGVYNALINDTGMKKQVERIKEHEWVKVVENEQNNNS
ncbi:hypothetical protein C5S30_01895 [ANME-1 cluster archaeon GoMg4]|nr:hypothetical protein [ANME-1 cluster archaeon GoMg4]